MTSNHRSSEFPKQFEELPREIRDIIYRHFIPPRAMILRTDSGGESIQALDPSETTSTPIKILQLNKKIRSEALDLMYKECTFTILALREWPPAFAIQRAEIPNFLAHPCWKSRTVRQIRNWQIDIEWQRNDSSSSQPRNIHDRLWEVVNILAANANIDSVSVQFPCACSFIYGGFRLHLLDRHEMLSIRDTTGREARDTIKAMLEPLKELRAAQQVTFSPQVFVQTQGPPFDVRPCKQTICNEMMQEFKDVMEGRVLGPREKERKHIFEPPAYFRHNWYNLYE